MICQIPLHMVKGQVNLDCQFGNVVDLNYQLCSLIIINFNKISD